MRRPALEECGERFVVETGAVECRGDRRSGPEVVVQRDIGDVLLVVGRRDAPGVPVEEMEHGGQAGVEVERRGERLEIVDQTLPQVLVRLPLVRLVDRPLVGEEHGRLECQRCQRPVGR